MYLGTVSKALEDDHRVLVEAYGKRRADIEERARSCSPLYVRTRILKRMDWQIGSQCSSIKMGLMWLYFFVLVTRQAATF